MTLEIHTYPLGPLATNTYVLVDPISKLAVVIDPTFNSRYVVKAIHEGGWKPFQVWLTHAHFDHTAGVQTICELVEPPLPIGIHPDDLPLYHDGGGAHHFGIDMPPLPEPTLLFNHGQILKIGEEMIEVRHTPGHSPGHVIFYIPQAKTAITGDLIFKQGVGRTDLDGGSHTKLLKSISTSVLSLPRETRLLSGHGPATTVGEEIDTNPYLMD